MSDTKMSEIIKASLDGIRVFSDTETVIGSPIVTQSGVTVIPVSKITIGLATGGIDYGNKRFSTPQSFGGGGGTGISVIPIAFLTVNSNGESKILHLDEQPDALTRLTDLIEQSPKIIERIKDSLT